VAGQAHSTCAAEAAVSQCRCCARAARARPAPAPAAGRGVSAPRRPDLVSRLGQGRAPLRELGLCSEAGFGCLRHHLIASTRPLLCSELRCCFCSSACRCEETEVSLCGVTRCILKRQSACTPAAAGPCRGGSSTRSPCPSSACMAGEAALVMSPLSDQQQSRKAPANTRGSPSSSARHTAKGSVCAIDAPAKTSSAPKSLAALPARPRAASLPADRARLHSAAPAGLHVAARSRHGARRLLRQCVRCTRMGMQPRSAVWLHAASLTQPALSQPQLCTASLLRWSVNTASDPPSVMPAQP